MDTQSAVAVPAMKKVDTPMTQQAGSAIPYGLQKSPEPEPEASPDKLTVALDLRLGLLSVLTIASVVVLVTLTLVFQHGVTLRTYDGSTMSQSDRDKLLDKYNGYSGNVASALGRPLELVVSLMTQFLVLRFLTSTVLRPQPTWRVTAVALAVSAVLGFFLNNGFNALNVQLRDADVTAVIKASDVASKSNTSLSDLYTSKTSTISRTFSELQPRNPVTNTILRNTVLPRLPNALPQCDVSYTGMRFPMDVVEYGFTQREWMAKLLPEALDAKRLRVVINATDKHANDGVNSANMPMNASLAADLFLTAVLSSYAHIGWGKSGQWLNATEAGPRKTLQEGKNVSAAVAAGLLPFGGSLSESDKRDWLLRSILTFYSKHDFEADNRTSANIGVEFAHVDLSPSITYDSVTMEVDGDSVWFTSALARDNKTRLTNGDTDCGPWPALCSFERLDDDTPVVVHAYATCTNADGSEELMTEPSAIHDGDYAIHCPQTSNSSLIVLSATKRLVADALTANSTIPPDGLDTTYPVVTNLRKIYSFTVARVGWQVEDLARKYHATCDIPGGSGCLGLDMNLTDGTRLVVGEAALPFAQLSPLGFEELHNGTDMHPFPLVRLLEPAPSNKRGSAWGIMAGDLLLPHNAGNVTWDFKAPRQTTQCDIPREDRQQLVLNNHLYIESTLQTSYTAAIFFLFQNAVVRDTLTMAKAQHQQQTLSFDGNQQHLSLWVSIPTWNAMLTCVGSFLLLVAFLSATMWSKAKESKASEDGSSSSDTLQAITTPHVIARVLLDDNAFPSTLVRRRVVTDASGAGGGDVEEFYIESVVLKRSDAARGV